MIPVAFENTVGNTVLNSQNADMPLEYGFDWLSVVIPLSTIDGLLTMLDFVADSLGDAWDIQNTSRHIGRSWACWAKSCRGAVAGWNRLENGYELMLSLNGSALSGSGSLRPLMRLFSYLHNQGAKANRLDTYADDRRGKFAELRPLIESAVDANQQVGFRDDSYHWSRKDGVKRETYNLGSRSSQSYHRIYDKEDRVRWEREIKEGKADCMFSLACKAFESLDGSTDFDILMGSLIRDSIFSSVNFIERNGKNLERGKRLEWWEDFLKSLEVQPLKLASVKRVSCFHKMRDWVDKSVAKVLAKMQAVFPDFPVWIRRVVEQGQDRLSNSDKAMIEAFNREVREREREFSNRMEERGMEERENEKRFFERMRE